MEGKPHPILLFGRDCKAQIKTRAWIRSYSCYELSTHAWWFAPTISSSRPVEPVASFTSVRNSQLKPRILSVLLLNSLLGTSFVLELHEYQYTTCRIETTKITSQSLQHGQLLTSMCGRDLLSPRNPFQFSLCWGCHRRLVDIFKRMWCNRLF